MISVCMATHNGEKYIKEQLDSILCQLSSDDEVIISDDGSTDNTLSIIESYNDSRLKIFHLVHSEKNRVSHYYCTKNFENALNHANGDYIFLSDHDDFWMPNKINVCLKYLNSNILVVHDFFICDQNLEHCINLKYNGIFKFGNLFFCGMYKYYGCAIAFNRKLLDKILPFPKNLVAHDAWIGIVSEVVGNVAFVKEPLIKYRVRNDSVSHAASNGFFYAIQYRMYIWFNLIKRFGLQCFKLL